MNVRALNQGGLPRVKWGSIATGVLCALGVQLALGFFGMALGFAARAAGFGVGILAGVWSLLVPFVALYIGADVAVRSAATDTVGSYLHGLLVWCIGLIATAFLLIGPLAAGAAAWGSFLAGIGSLLGLAGALFGSRAGRRAVLASMARPGERAREAREGPTGVPSVPMGREPLPTQPPSEHRH